jgi:hypothetical protein
MATGVNDLTKRRGRVVDASGAPVPDALIVIVASTVSMPEIALLSDNAGRFELGLPPGHFALRAHSPGGGRGEVELEGALNVEEIVIVIDR